MLILTKVSRKVGNSWLLDDISLRIPTASLFIIHGESGSGKTTLLRVINGLDPIISGTISSDGVLLTRKNIWQWRKDHPLVFQDARLFPGTIEDNILLPARYHGLSVNIKEILNKVDLKKDPTTDVATLSGGERQKVAIARALVLRPKMLLLDEPTSNLDLAATLHLEKMLLQLNRQKMSIVIVTHDREQVKRLGNYGAVLKNGKVVKKGIIIEEENMNEQ